MIELPPIVGLYGRLGAGKSGYTTEIIRRFKEHSPWSPVVTTVPIALPGEGSMFIARSVADYIAAGLVLTRFGWSAEAEKISKLPRGWLARRRRPAPYLHNDVVQFYVKLQAEYRKIAETIDWQDYNSLDLHLLAHDYLVLGNFLGVKSIFDVRGEETAAFAKNFYSSFDHIHGNFRFAFREPYLPFMLCLDEIGVAASADDNKMLKESAFYPFLAQLRKFGGKIIYNGHHPSRVFKQLREVTDYHIIVSSFNIKPLRGKIYFCRGYADEASFDAQTGLKWWRLDWVTFDTLSRYPTYWIVRQVVE